MSWQRSYWFRVPLTKQLKRDSVGHAEETINNAATVVVSELVITCMLGASWKKHSVCLYFESLYPEKYEHYDCSPL